MMTLRRARFSGFIPISASVVQEVESQGDLPEGMYALVEFFCPDPTCDCHRVMLNIACEEQLARGYLATISYGFDRDEEMAGPYLDPLHPQSEYSEALLDLVTSSALSECGSPVQRLRIVKCAGSDTGSTEYTLAWAKTRFLACRLQSAPPETHRAGPGGSDWTGSERRSAHPAHCR